MQIYEVRISHGARADMAELRKFLKSMMTVEGAIRYANNMREEIKTLAFYADLYGKTTSMTLRQIHPEARRWYLITVNGCTSIILKHPSS